MTMTGKSSVVQVVLIMVLLGSALCSSLTAADELVGNWTFYEGSGTVVSDSSGAGNDGTLCNMTAPWGDGICDSALSFDGTDDYISVGYLDGGALSSFTYTAWIKVNDLSGCDHDIEVIEFAKNTQCRIALANEENPSLFIRWRKPNGTYASYGLTGSMASGQWHRIAVTYNDSSEVLTGYLDGEKEIATDMSAIGRYSDFDYVKIGYGTTYKFFSGTMDEVRIYNYALSSDAIKEVSSGLIGCWKMDEGSGTTATDGSGAGNDGTLCNMTAPWVDGICDSALSFDGTNDYISVGYLDGGALSSFTYAAWIKVEDLSGCDHDVETVEFIKNTQCRIALTNEENPSLFIRWRKANGSYASYNLTGSMASGQWHRMAVAYDDENKTLTGYLDGARGVENDMSAIGRYGDFDNIKIGYGTTYKFFNGVMDEVRLYDRVLYADEITKISDGLVGSWEMDEGSGTVVTDNSGEENDGTLVNMNSPACWTADGYLQQDGTFSNVLSFDGTDDYINIGYLDGGALSSFTYTAWIKVDDLSGCDHDVEVIEFAKNIQCRIALTNEENPSLFIRWRKAAGTYASYDLTGNMPSGQWHRITVTYDDEDKTLTGYLNGAKEIETDMSAVGRYGDFDSIRIGYGTTYKFFNGAMDMVKIYNRALGAGEISLIYLPEISALPNQNYYTTENAVATVALNIAENTVLSNCYLVAKDSSGNSLGTCNDPDNLTDLTFATSALSNGENTITIELRKDGGEFICDYDMNILKRAANSGNEVKIDLQNGIVLRNGSGFFPIGLYMAGISSDATADFQTAASAGFNTVIRWQNSGCAPADSTTYLENAADYNLMVVDRHESYTVEKLCDYKSSTSQYFWDAYIDERDDILAAVGYAKQESNLLAYYTFDEPVEAQIPAAEDIYMETKSEDGYHPTFALSMAGYDQDAVVDACDISGVDLYIKPPRTTWRLASSVDWVTKYACIVRDQARENRKPFWLVLSAQYDADTEIKRAIRPDEQRCQSYLGLIHGAKGIFYYFYPIAHEDTWECFEDLTIELTDLAPCVLTPDLEQAVAYSEYDYDSSSYVSAPFDPANGVFVDVQVSLRKAPAGESYDYVLLATNTKAYSVDVDYGISLLGGSGTVSRMFDAATYTVTDSGFSDSLAAFATRAYTFSSSSTDIVTIAVAVTPPQTIPAAETSYPGTGRPDMTNVFRNPALETDSRTLANWPDYCWPWNIDQDNRIGTANQCWGLAGTPDTGLCEAIDNDGGDSSGAGNPGSTCLKITRNGIMTGFFSNLALTANQSYTFTAYIKKVGTAAQSVRLGTSECGYIDHTLSETWTRYEYSFTVSEDGAPYNYFKIQPLCDGTILVDAIQVELTTASSPVPFTTN